MIPLPKWKRDARLCENWRGISLLSVPGKLLGMIIAPRLTTIAEGVVGESANGFRPGRGRMDCTALVRTLTDKANASESGTLHLVYADLKRAFDAVHRGGLWLTLQRHGVPPRLLAVVRVMHEGMKSKVRVDGSLSAPYPCRTGVRQGCVVAPVLMNLYYAAVLAEWRRQAPPDIELRFAADGNLQNSSTRTYREHDRTRVGDTVYADDTALFSAT